MHELSYAPFNVYGKKELDEFKRLKYSAYSALVFAIVASPSTYQLTQFFFGRLFEIASRSGNPTVAGLAFHAVVYMLILWGMMHLNL